MLQATPYSAARGGSILSAAHNPAMIATDTMRRGQVSVRTSTVPTAWHRGQACDHVEGVLQNLIARPYSNLLASAPAARRTLSSVRRTLRISCEGPDLQGRAR